MILSLTDRRDDAILICRFDDTVVRKAVCEKLL